MASKNTHPTVVKKRSSSRNAVIVFVLIFAAIGAKQLFSSFAATTYPESIITALYANTTQPSWQQVEQSAPTVKYAIVNICAPDGSGSGCNGRPADAKSTPWVATIQALQKAGITPLFYISTNYGAVPTSTIESELSNAKSWYGLTSPMFDTMSVSSSCTAGFIPEPCTTYYSTLYNYALSLGASTVVLNPGTAPSSSSYIFGTKEILQVYEGTAASFRNATFPSWMKNYSAGQFAATLSAGSASTISTDISNAAKYNIGNFYEVDEPNPPNYSTLPSYWSTEVKDVAALSAPSTPAPTPAPTPTPSPNPSPSPSQPGQSAPPADNSSQSTNTSSGDGLYDDGSGDNGAVSYGTSDGGQVDVSVDGSQLSENGKLDTTQLTNGKHTITVTKNGKTTTQTIYVHNKLTAYQRVRNYMYPELAKYPKLRDTAVILTLLSPFIITGLYIRGPFVRWTKAKYIALTDTSKYM